MVAFVNTYRSDPGSGEAHHAIQPTIGGTQRHALAHALLRGNSDFGGGATGNVHNAATADACGTFLDCDGATFAIFKIELSAPGVSRRFYPVFKDKNGTPLFSVDGRAFEVTALPDQDGPTGAATRVSGYYHAGRILVPIYGDKEVSLWLLDGLSAPTVHVWGTAV